jgi:hypothetical protein
VLSPGGSNPSPSAKKNNSERRKRNKMLRKKKKPIGFRMLRPDAYPEIGYGFEQRGKSCSISWKNFSTKKSSTQ